MINYGTLEEEIVERLNDYFETNELADFIAQAIPQNESELKKSIDKERVYVRYAGSDYPNTSSINQVRQDETITIQFIFLASKLRDGGLYDLVRHVKICMLGYKPDNCATRMTIAKYDLIDFENGGLVNVLDMKTATVLVQKEDGMPADISAPPTTINIR